MIAAKKVPMSVGKSNLGAEIANSLTLEDWHLAARGRHARRNILGLTFLAFCHSVLAFVCGDTFFAFLLAAFIGASLVVYFTVRQISVERWLNATHLLGLIFMWAIQVYGPSGLPGAMLILPFGLAIVTSADRFDKGILAVLLISGFRLALEPLGLDQWQSSAVPAFPSVLLTSAYCLAAVQIGLIGFRNRTRQTRASISENIQRFKKEHELLQQRSVELKQANNRISQHTYSLQLQVKKERQLVTTLRNKLSDEQGILRAIDQDLRQPTEAILTEIKSLAAQLPGVDSDQTMADYFSFAEEAGGRLLDMLSQMEAYINFGKDACAPIAVNLDQMLKAAWKEASEALPKAPNPVYEASVSPDCRVLVCQEAFQRLCSELFKNAIRFKEAHLPAQVSSEVKVLASGDIQLLIRDRGIGIAPEQLEKAWGLFNRLHAHLGYEGRGIGLTLSRKLALQEGIELSISPNEGPGLCVTLIFPASIVIATPSPLPEQTDKNQEHPALLGQA